MLDEEARYVPADEETEATVRRIAQDTWKERLYLDRMPGRTKERNRHDTVADWLEEMRENGIRTVVCLAPNGDIERQSPEYASWRARQPKEESRYDLIDFPIADFGVPSEVESAAFWELARSLGEHARDGEKLFIHRGAGIGRTGTMAVAILMTMGYSYDEAYAEIRAAGSEPETPDS